LNQDGRQGRIAQRFPAPPMPALAVSLPDLAAGSTVRGTVELRPTIANAPKVDRVEYRLDDTPLQTVAEPPYNFTWSSGTAPPGEHTLIVTARLGEQTAEQRIPLTVAPVSPPAPATVATSAAGLPGVTGTASTAGTPSAVGTAQPGTTAATGATQSGTATSSTARTPTATATSSSGSGSVAGFSAPVLIGIGTLIAAGIVGVIYASSGRRNEQQRVVDATSIPIGDDDRSSRSTVWPALPPGHASDHKSVHPADRPTAGFGAAPTGDFREAETKVAPFLPPVHGPPSGALGRSTLAVSVAGGPPRSWPLALDQIIGRAAGPGVIVVTDPQVSRRHARISWEGGHFVYRDLGPMNPTRLDGRTLPNPYILKDGDRLRVGRAEIVFHA
jgi:hypothetical protein